MKCIFTGEQTLNKTRNQPVSREGRIVLRERQQVMAEARLEQHQEMISELNERLSAQAKENGTVHVPLEAQSDANTFLPSIAEVIAEQVRQNETELAEEIQSETSDSVSTAE